MTCHRCGSGQIEDQVSDLPFKLDAHKILVVKQVPAMVCASCGETMLADPVMAQIDRIIAKVQGMASELEVVQFAALGNLATPGQDLVGTWPHRIPAQVP